VAQTSGTVIRAVRPADIAAFYDHQADATASEMAAFPTRDRAAHDAHWKKVLADDTAIARTIVVGDVVVGNLGCFVAHDERHVGYWIGREHWGHGYATAALAEFVDELQTRPLHARVAEHNLGSIRVLTKCGFVVVGEEQAPGDPVKEIILRLDARSGGIAPGVESAPPTGA
jgi:RimJ/RimL family protein N-acetyltransferase